MTARPIRVSVAGAHGKMGTIAAQTVRATSDMEYVGGLARDARGGDEFDAAETLFEKARPEVIVDFTRFPDSKRIALAAIAAGVRPVIGTSGYGESDIAELRSASDRASIGCLFVPNFGVGAVLMMKYAADAARHFRAVEIVEMHETGKNDAPSGTALATARRLAAAGSFDRPATKVLKADGARGAELAGIGIHSLRLPGVVAHQEVVFGGDGETLRIVHDSSSRTSFMNGMLLAIRAARDLDRFVEGLESLL